MTQVLLSDLDQHFQLGPGLPELVGLGEDVPAGRTSLEAEGEAGVGEVSLGGEQKLRVWHQEVHLQTGQHLLNRRTLLLVWVQENRLLLIFQHVAKSFLHYSSTENHAICRT